MLPKVNYFNTQRLRVAVTEECGLFPPSPEFPTAQGCL